MSVWSQYEHTKVTIVELLLNQSAFKDSYEFEGGALTMVGTTLSRTASFVGKSVKEAAKIFPELHFMPIAIQRFGTQYTLIPRGDTIFKEGDRVVFITSKGGDEELCNLIGKRKTQIKDVMILGGGQIGSITANELANSNFNIKVVEKSKDRAIELADELSDALVINGDGRNVEVLDEDDMETWLWTATNSPTISLLGKAQSHFAAFFGFQVDLATAEPGNLGQLGDNLVLGVSDPILDVESHDRTNKLGFFLFLAGGGHRIEQATPHIGHQ